MNPETPDQWVREGRLHKTSGELNFWSTGITKDGKPIGVWHQVEDATAEQVVQLFAEHIGLSQTVRTGMTPRNHIADEARHELAGKNLACWCPLTDAQGNRVPCHADVLLELANGGAER